MDRTPPTSENLRATSGGDWESNTQVERLKSWSGQDLNLTGDHVPAAEEVSANPDVPGFEIEKELGRGGMGVVYQARQKGLDRTVALKMILGSDFASPEQRLRFQIEAENAARVQHPGIVQIYAFGTHEGHPYLALEYVDGGSLDKVLAKEPLRPRVAADLVARLADAIHAAHTAGIIPRDLKPANVPPARGAAAAPPLGPKVTDFGLAKQFNTGQGLTATGEIVGTPCYMAPEQANGTPARSATGPGGSGGVGPPVDIYALGAILYECLTGRPPFRAATSLDTILQVIHDEPVPPTRLQPTTPRDLETICLKCLRKNPSKRYATAADLAGDLQDWLAHKPITARPVGRLERTLKWCRRYPAVAASLVVATVAAIVASGLACWAVEAEQLARSNEVHAQAAAKAERQARELAQQAQARAEQSAAMEKTAREQAERERQYAQAIADFVQNDFLGLASVEGQGRFGRDAGDRLGKDATLQELLDRAAIKLDERTDLNPRTEADLRWMIGVNYRGLGELHRAVTHLEKCVALRQQVLGPNHEDTLVAQNSLAYAYRYAGRLPEALPLLEQVRDAQVSTLGADHPDTLATLNNQGTGYLAAGRVPEALSLLEQVRDERVAKLGANHPDTLGTMNNLAHAYRQVGRVPEALLLLEQVAGAVVPQLGANHPNTLTALNSLAMVYRDAGRLPESLRLFEQVRDAQVSTLGADHPETLATLHNLAAAYRAAGRLPEALRLFEQVRDARVAKLGANHPSTLTTLHSLATAYQAAGRLSEAVTLFEQVRDVRVTQLGPDHPSTLATLHNLAEAYRYAGLLSEAIAVNEQVRDMRASKLGADHPDTLTTLNNLAMAYQAAGRLPEALPLFEQAAQGIEKRRFQHEYSVRIIPNTFRAYEQAQQFDKADEWRRKWLNFAKQQVGPESPAYAGELAMFGLSLLSRKQWAEAEATLRECLTIREKSQPDAWTTFNTMSMLGGALLGRAGSVGDASEKAKLLAEAEPLLLKGYEGIQDRRASPGSDPQIVAAQKPRLLETLDRLIELYTTLEKPDEVKKWQAEKEKLGQP